MILADNLWSGAGVRLTAVTKDDLPALARWYADAGFLRLLDARPARPQTQEELGKWLEEAQKSPTGYLFAVRPLDSDTLLGFIEVDGILWSQGAAWLGIGIGDRDNWGKGIGAEVMRLALKFAFAELNLHRVQLTVFAYNDRAIALYEKLGFQREGIFREFLHRDGARYDMYLYGLLRREWEARQAG
jgi:RimJ/RimL family protein N-acetyltransferase